MITFSTSQIKNVDLSHGLVNATTTPAQIHSYDLNLCTDLHCTRRTLTLAAPRSCAATVGVGGMPSVQPPIAFRP